MMSHGLPVALANLFEDSNFIAAAPDRTKPCFNGKYYVENTFTGWVWRRIGRENCTNTADNIKKICEAMSEALDSYQHTKFYSILLDKAVNLRNGVLRIKRAYEGDYKTTSSLENAILILDIKLPEHIKVAYGIVGSRDSSASCPINIPEPIKMRPKEKASSLPSSRRTYPLPPSGLDRSPCEVNIFQNPKDVVEVLPLEDDL